MPPQIAASWYQSMPPASKRHRESALGLILARAMASKGQELSTLHKRPVRYTYRDLEKDANISFSTIGHWIHGVSRPEPETLQAVIRALGPHINGNDAMIAAGYMPQDTNLQSLLRRVARFPQERIAGLLAAMERSTFGREQPLMPEDAPELYEWPEKPPRRRRQKTEEEIDNTTE